MTLDQWLSIATLAGMMALFIWGRFRYDVTAVIALLAALLVGIVKPKDAFTGFSDDIVIIVGSALVLSAAVQRSGAIEAILGLVTQRVTRVRSQLLFLTSAVGFSSALIKNVGALAMLMPAALQMAKKNETSPSVYLMPMSFASLLGGLMTLVGTSPQHHRQPRAGGDDRPPLFHVRFLSDRFRAADPGPHLLALWLPAAAQEQARDHQHGRSAQHFRLCD